MSATSSRDNEAHVQCVGKCSLLFLALGMVQKALNSARNLANQKEDQVHEDAETHGQQQCTRTSLPQHAQDVLA